MRTAPVAPKFVTWLVLLFGLAEVPWVIFLLFNQQTTVEANHLRFASLGLGLAAAALCGGAAWSIWTRRRSAATLCIAATTSTLYLAIMVTLSPDMQATGIDGLYVPLLIVIPGAIAGGLAASHVLRGSTEQHRRVMSVAAAVLALIALSFLVHTIGHLLDESTTGWMSRARAIVVILDTGETVGLIGAGIASLSGHVRATLVFGVIATTLLVGDAFANVVGAPQGPAFEQALFYLVVGEIPSIVLSLIMVRSASKRLNAADLEPTTGAPGLPDATLDSAPPDPAPPNPARYVE